MKIDAEARDKFVALMNSWRETASRAPGQGNSVARVACASQLAGILREAETPEPAPGQGQASQEQADTADPNPWRTHDGDGMPECYAAAQFVEWSSVATPDGSVDRIKSSRADAAPWEIISYHRPVIQDGLPVVSADGLEPWARYVAESATGQTLQFAAKPEPSLKAEIWADAGGHHRAPTSHRLPGDWRQSLAVVEGR